MVSLLNDVTWHLTLDTYGQIGGGGDEDDGDDDDDDDDDISLCALIYLIIF